jgi:hypothetical protein
MSNPLRVVCGKPDCKETHQGDLCGTAENVPWIRSTYSREGLGLPSCGTDYCQLETAATDVGYHYLELDHFRTESVPTLRRHIGYCFDKSKYAQRFPWNSHHFELWLHIFSKTSVRVVQNKTKQTNSVALSPRANYTDWSTATCRRNLVPTFVDRVVSRGQRGGSPRVVKCEWYSFAK